MVVYATHVDSRRFSNLLGDEIVPIRGQAMAVEAPEGFECPGSFATHWKLNVWRRAPSGELWLGGWRHDAWDRAYWKTRPEVDSYLQEDVQGWFEAAFPGAAPLRVERRWSGIFGWTADYLPLVGPLPGTPRELVVSGFSGGGLPFAFGCGRIIAHAVTGKDPLEGTALFNPRRFL
jgi:glycine/D-amino acid oxidase-like deaminating enzyme